MDYVCGAHEMQAHHEARYIERYKQALGWRKLGKRLGLTTPESLALSAKRRHMKAAQTVCRKGR